MRRRLWILLTALIAGSRAVARRRAGDHLRRPRRRPPSVGRPRRLLRRERRADPAVQRLAPLADEVPHGRPLHRSGRRDEATPAPALARIWFAEGPITFDPAYHGGSCNVGGPYTGYPCASQNATGTPVPHPGLERRAHGAADERRRRRARSRRRRGCRRATASSRPSGTVEHAAASKRGAASRPDDRRLRRAGR